jgi:hypothetical protein
MKGCTDGMAGRNGAGVQQESDRSAGLLCKGDAFAALCRNMLWPETWTCRRTTQKWDHTVTAQQTLPVTTTYTKPSAAYLDSKRQEGEPIHKIKHAHVCSTQTKDPRNTQTAAVVVAPLAATTTATAAAQNSWLTEPTLALLLAGRRLPWMLGSTPPV